MPLESIGGGAYRIAGVLGQGGFGTVYRAYQASLEREVAIKVLRGDLISAAGGVDRFRREARAAARLSGHPNIVTIYDYGEQDGLAYLILEFVDGPTLQALSRETLPDGEIIRIVREVAAALDYAHTTGLVHRDVKPANIMLARDGRVVLTDFGIVKLLEGTSTLTVSGPATGGALGTPAYMAPEQVENGEVGPAADLYALGVVCYELLAGRVPFAGSPLSIMHQQVHARPPAMSSFGRAVPPAVERVVERALAKQPSERFESATALARALEAALVGEQPTQLLPPVAAGGPTQGASGGAAAPAPLSEPRPTRPRQPAGRSGGWLVPTLVIVNLVALVVVALSLSGALGGGA
jgi:serine/threonine-protein kinase